MSAAPHAMSPNREGRPLVIYHKDCTDGACAAWAAAHHLGRAGLPEPVLLAAHPDITPEGAFAEEWAYKIRIEERRLPALARPA